MSKTNDRRMTKFSLSANSNTTQQRYLNTLKLTEMRPAFLLFLPYTVADLEGAEPAPWVTDRRRDGTPDKWQL